MSIGLLSDTHDSLEAALAALEFFQTQSVGLVIHGGDWTTPASFHQLEAKAQSLDLPMNGVLGNNDAELKTLREEIADFSTFINLPDEEVLQMTADDKKIAVYHGQDHIILHALINSQTFDILIKGHSHRIEYEPVGSTLVVNPGSAAFSIPKRQEFNPTVCILNPDTREAAFFEFKAGEFKPKKGPRKAPL